jgi:nucleoside-diphosphate-sugar epimerase
MFKIFGNATKNKKLDYIHGIDAARVIVDLTRNEKTYVGHVYDIGGLPKDNFLSVEDVLKKVIMNVGSGSYEVVDDFRMQPAISTRAKNDWTEIVEPFEMIKFDDGLRKIIEAWETRYSYEDFMLAVAYFEGRFEWGV